MQTRRWSIPALAAAGLWWGGCAHTQTAALPNLTSSRPTPAQQPVAETPSASPDTGQADLEAMLRNDVLHFDYDQANLSGDDRHRLQNIAEILSKHPQLTVRISGNCDERGTEDFNLQARSGARCRCPEIPRRSRHRRRENWYSQLWRDRPVNPAHTSQAWAENRRDDIRPRSQNP